MPMTLVENITNVTCPHCGKKMIEVSDWILLEQYYIFRFENVKYIHMNFIKSELYKMVKRIKCPHCQKHLAGESNLQRHIKAFHKSKNY